MGRRDRPPPPNPAPPTTAGTRPAPGANAGVAANALPSALAHVDAIVARMGARRLAVFLDYDGTLTPIVERPELAVMSEEMRGVVRQLADRCRVAIISGRGRADVAAMVGLDQLVYAGSHGFDIGGPGIAREIGSEFRPRLAAAARALAERLGAVAGALVEDKRLAIAVHYRLVAPAEVEAVRRAVDHVAREFPDLRQRGGKMVIELQPDIAWDKGRVVLALLETLGDAADDVLPLYIGDDLTDEDAFRVLADRGMGVVVQETPRPTAAHYRLASPAEVGQFLSRLAAALATKG